MPSHERLVSIFLEDITNKDLHATLYMKHHKNLNRCINDAIDYDDNCVNSFSKGDHVNKDHPTQKLVTTQIEEITQGIMDIMQRMYGPPRIGEQ